MKRTITISKLDKREGISERGPWTAYSAHIHWLEEGSHGHIPQDLIADVKNTISEANVGMVILNKLQVEANIYLCTNTSKTGNVFNRVYVELPQDCYEADSK